MQNSRYTWFIWSILLTFSFYFVLPLDYLVPSPLISLGYVLLMIGWLIPLFHIFLPNRFQVVIKTLRELRRIGAIVTWLLTLLLFIIILLLWGLVATAEYDTFLLIFFLFMVGFLWFMGSKEEDWRIIGAGLAKNRLTNIFLLMTTLLIALASVELFMRWTMVETNNFGLNLSSREWVKRYYRPLNDLNYRAYPPQDAAENQQSILVLGDSFAVGYGINDLDDVFAYQMGTILGEDYLVNLVGGLGISPTIDYVTLYPYQPDILVLSHFVNDIDHTIENQGLPDFEPTGFVGWWEERYFIASFAYWNLYVANQMLGEYNVSVLAPYENEAQWSEHAARLTEFVDWSKANDVQLVLIIWATLEDMEASAIANAKVADFFQSQDIPVILMADYLADLSVSERTVNRLDPHPNERSHRIAAEALADVILNLDN
jgi:hypothetical protein